MIIEWNGRELDGDVLITARHFQPVGYCVTGAWQWFKSHNLDFRDFIKRGGWRLEEFGFVDDAIVRLYDIAISEGE